MTAFFDCSKSGSRSIVLGLERLDVFLLRREVSMVVQLETYGLEARFWGASGYADNPPGIVLTVANRSRSMAYVAYRERMRVHPNRALPVVPSSLARSRQAVTEAFLCEQILQPRLVRVS